jgi:hypothetical protein
MSVDSLCGFGTVRGTPAGAGARISLDIPLVCEVLRTRQHVRAKMTHWRGVVAGVCLGLWACAPVQAQSNRVEFRGCRVGDAVVFQAAKPMVMAAKATLLAITDTHLTVACGLERYVVPTDEVIRIEKTATQAVPVAPAPPAAPAPGRPPPGDSKPASPPASVEALLGMVQGQVLGPFSTDENFAKTTNHFATTMRDYIGGKTTEADLRAKAAELLKQLDQYQPERQKDPQYESYIEVLRSFVENRKLSPPQ